MSLESLISRVAYAGNGVTTSFSFPYKFLDDEHLVVLFVDGTTGAETLKVITTDYAVTGAGEDSGGSVNFLVAPPTGTNVLIYRDPPITQTTDLEEGGPPAAEAVEAEFDKRTMIEQRLRSLIDRSLGLMEGFTGSFLMKLPPLLPAGHILAINETGDGWVLLTPEEVASEAGGFDEAEYAYEGYSARFNENFSSSDLGDTLEKILDLTYTAPTISLSASGSGTVREKGDAVTASTLTATITKRSDPISEVRFYLNPSTLLDTQVSGGAIPNGGSSTYNWTGSFSDNATFRAEVDDNGDTGGPTTVSSTATFTFVYPYYFGAGAAGLTAANVAALTKDIRTSNANLTKTFGPNGSQVLYFAYPASYGALTAIYDVNNFNTLPDWTLRTENITGLDANPVSYRIYEFNNVPLSGSYDYRFVR